MANEEQPSVGRYSVTPFIKPEVYSQIARRRTDTQQTSWHWSDTWHEEHHRAFVVAKMCKADLLEEVRQSLLKAVAEGQTYAEWKKAIIPKLENEWLDKTLGDLWKELSPEDQEKHKDKKPSKKQWNQKITSKRLETIYRTNMKVAHVAGQYQTLVAKSHLYPYWQYNTQEDDRVRNAHAALNGLVFRHDDPIWETHFPPNGWRCRCYVRCLDDDDLAENGLTVLYSEDLESYNVPSVPGKTKLAYIIDGEEVTAANGWSYNPGAVDYIDQVAKAKAEIYSPGIKEHFIKALENEPKQLWLEGLKQASTIEEQKITADVQKPIAEQRKLATKTPITSLEDQIDEEMTMYDLLEKETTAAERENAIISRLGLDENLEIKLRQELYIWRQSKKGSTTSQFKQEASALFNLIVDNQAISDAHKSVAENTCEKLFIHNHTNRYMIDQYTGDIDGSHHFFVFLEQIRKIENLDISNQIKAIPIENLPGAYKIIYNVYGGPDQKKTIYLPSYEEQYFQRLIEVFLTWYTTTTTYTPNAKILLTDIENTSWELFVNHDKQVKTMYPINPIKKEGRKDAVR